MRTLDEIRHTPVLLLTEEEIAMLDPAGQEWARRARQAKAKEDACPRHEPVNSSTWEESRRGWHRIRCIHCGRDMSYDSGD